MEGYSVDEAATVLGVPAGRVWELLARGVLAGTQEDGGGMRVFLRGKPSVPAPVAQALGEDESAGSRGGKGNGNGGTADAAFEASPFRELLTEFRNLTERYGQALLALGEARGEVAGLRTRVELLEARLDLRLPGPAGWSSTWEGPGPGTSGQAAPQGDAVQADARTSARRGRESTVDDRGTSDVAGAEAADAGAADVEAIQPEPAATEAGAHAANAEVEATEPEPATTEGADEGTGSAESTSGEHDAGDEAAVAESSGAASRRHQRRRRGSHAAVTGIAEALARAEDPSAASLPGAEETAQALAALRREVSQGAAVPLIVLGADAESHEAVDQLSAPAAVAPTAELSAEELEIQEGHAEEPWVAAAPRGESEIPEVAAEQPQIPEVAAEQPQIRDDHLATVADAIEAAEVAGVDESIVAGPERSDRPVAHGAADVAAPEYSSEWDEPDWIAEEDLEESWEAHVEPEASNNEASAREDAAVSGEAVTNETIADEPTIEEPMIDERVLPGPITEEPVGEPTATASEAEAMAPEPPAPEMVTTAARDTPSAPTVPALSGQGQLNDRLIPEMADWPPPPDEEIAAEIEPPMARPEETIESVAGSADYLLLYEPIDGPPVTEPMAASEVGRGPGGGEVSDALEEELMWLGDEFRPSTTAWKGLGEAPAPAPTVDVSHPGPGSADVGSSPDAARWDEAAELEQLARLRGWDEDELTAIRSLLGEQAGDASGAAGGAEASPGEPATVVPAATEPAATEPAAPEAAATEPAATEPAAPEPMPPGQEPVAPRAAGDLSLPGAEELDEAVAALRDAPAAPPAPVPTPPTVASAPSVEPGDAGAAPAGEAAAPPPTPPSASRIPQPVHLSDEDWLRGRRGPAASAYRRLRRLFPG